MRLAIIIFLAVSATVLVGCACEDIGMKAPPTTRELIGDCGGDAHCLKDQGVKYTNANVCDEIDGSINGGPKSKCYILIAKESLDAGMCERITGGPGAYDKEECYYQVALAKNDPGICEKIGRDYYGGSTDLTRGGFDYQSCVDKTSKGSIKKEECGDEFLPCCGTSTCYPEQPFELFCNQAFRCQKCGQPGMPCCPYLDGFRCLASEGVTCQDGICQ